MDEYLIDREILGKFVDELFKKKPLDVANIAELNTMREAKMRELDDSISSALFDNLSAEQTTELEAMLDSNEQSSEVFETFFERAGIVPEKVISETMQRFGESFLGGEND